MCAGTQCCKETIEDMKNLPLKRGDLVRMSRAHKEALKANHCAPHVREFGRCIGVVQGPVDWGNGTFGPEVDVRWKPSRLRYMYSQEDLVVVKRS
jgi:hypothetical protein